MLLGSVDKYWNIISNDIINTQPYVFSMYIIIYYIAYIYIYYKRAFTKYAHPFLNTWITIFSSNSVAVNY